MTTRPQLAIVETIEPGEHDHAHDEPIESMAVACAKAIYAAPVDAVSLWNRPTLRAAYPGTSDRFWDSALVELLRAGVLVRRGRGFVGRRSEIDAHLLKRTTLPTEAPAQKSPRKKSAP